MVRPVWQHSPRIASLHFPRKHHRNLIQVQYGLLHGHVDMSEAGPSSRHAGRCVSLNGGPHSRSIMYSILIAPSYHARLSKSKLQINRKRSLGRLEPRASCSTVLRRHGLLGLPQVSSQGNSETSVFAHTSHIVLWVGRAAELTRFHAMALKMTVITRVAISKSHM